jgi:hypothetical protein
MTLLLLKICSFFVFLFSGSCEAQYNFWLIGRYASIQFEVDLLRESSLQFENARKIVEEQVTFYCFLFYSINVYLIVENEI